MRIVKYGSSGCGPCSRMSHYDEKVVKELGLDFEYVKKRTPDYNSPGNEEIKKQLGGHPASPTYALVEGTNVLGSFSGGSDKGKFRERVQDLIAGNESLLWVGPERCDPKIQSIDVTSGKICPKGSGEVVEIEISTSCCEPNNGLFRIDPDGKGMQNMRGMDGVSFPNAGGGPNDHGDGKEIKNVRIKCDDFPYDIDDHDWDIRWQGDCDQKPGESFSITETFKVDSSCRDVDECKDDDDCPGKQVCKNGKCVDPDYEVDDDSHCTEFKGCDDFYWDCQPKDEKVCRPESGKEVFKVRISTHGCNNRCDEQGGGKDLHYEWRDSDGKPLPAWGEDKEAKIDITKDTPLGKHTFFGVAFCDDHPKKQELTHKFVVTVEDCDVPEPIEPEEYDCKCPPETIQLWYDVERGVYGSSYDKDRISSIQYIDAWKDTKALKLWLRPGGCNLDDVCQCVNLCSTTTAGGYDITEMEVECETNEKENSVTLTFNGTYLQKNDGSAEPEPEGEMETEPLLWVGPERCEPKIQDIEISSGRICPKGNGEVVTFTISTSCCEPNNGRFMIDAGDGKKNMKGMDGVSFPGKGDGPNDHGSGDEIKDIRIHCDEFEYDIKDHDWKIYWDGDCDQSPGASFDIDHTFKASSSCDEGPDKPDEDECETDEDCPSGEICVDGECVEGCRDDEDCLDSFICVDGECVKEFTEVSGNFYPNCISIQCCPDCDDEIPPFEPGDNDDCNNKPEPNPVPGTDGTAATVYLYDRLNHTFVFCCPILADVTWLLPFDAIPPIFQRYITAAATVRAAAQLVNNPQLFQLLKDRENTLRMECMNYELEQGDLNFLGQPDHTAYVGYQPIQTLNR